MNIVGVGTGLNSLLTLPGDNLTIYFSKFSSVKILEEGNVKKKSVSNDTRRFGSKIAKIESISYDWVPITPEEFYKRFFLDEINQKSNPVDLYIPNEENKIEDLTKEAYMVFKTELNDLLTKEGSVINMGDLAFIIHKSLIVCKMLNKIKKKTTKIPLEPIEKYLDNIEEVEEIEEEEDYDEEGPLANTEEQQMHGGPDKTKDFLKSTSLIGKYNKNFQEYDKIFEDNNSVSSIENLYALSRELKKIKNSRIELSNLTGIKEARTIIV